MKSIMVVEDEQDVLMLVSEIIGEDNYKIIQAVDGYQALAKAKQLHPDLIILDVMMPGIDGFEVCRKLKADEETKDIKVVIVSAKNTDQDIEEGMAAGADFYMPKPMKITELSTKIRELIG